MPVLNILVLTAHPPILAANNGGATRMYFNLKILARRHRVSLVSFIEQDAEKEGLADLALQGIDVKTVLRRAEPARHLWMPKPREHDEYASEVFRSLVQSMLAQKRFDVVQAEYFQMAQHVPRDLPALRVLTEHEIIFSNCRSAFRDELNFWRKCRRCYDWLVQLNYEARICRHFHRIACMTDEDRAELSRFVSPSRLYTVPIGVDSAYFDPQQVEGQESLCRILFVGNFRHPPNGDAVYFFVREVLPAVRREIPDAEFWIAGSNAHLLDQRILAGAEGVRVAGYVPDIRSCYSSAALFVAPILTGTGMRVKLLEAFSMGMAVVATPLAAQGFRSAHHEVMLTARTAESFAAETVRLLKNPQLRRILGANARQMIQEKYDWSVIGRKFLELVEAPYG
ncbi:MAG: glycosyltransferase family 4 protein [Acidobacteria bacterium]|nr:glycosyltransferase family 4 protein [Acidobacteriota bacterium]MCI0627762.1 glycosyltransferase family 4 protein [Acidobacteriota bacterium]MCI0723540.1 glycosyltransferase family 4 protein [Acidobacteriota bacterium]